jgi:hypothetical protein
MTNLWPASYYPRAIAPDTIEQLKAGILRLGLITAIIALDTLTIVADNQ